MTAHHSQYRQLIADCVFSYFSRYRPDDELAQQRCGHMLSELFRTNDVDRSPACQPLQQHWLSYKGSSQRALSTLEMQTYLELFMSELEDLISQREKYSQVYSVNGQICENRTIYPSHQQHRTRLFGQEPVENVRPQLTVIRGGKYYH